MLPVGDRLLCGLGQGCLFGDVSDRAGTKRPMSGNQMNMGLIYHNIVC